MNDPIRNELASLGTAVLKVLNLQRDCFRTKDHATLVASKQAEVELRKQASAAIALALDIPPPGFADRLRLALPGASASAGRVVYGDRVFNVSSDFVVELADPWTEHPRELARSSCTRETQLNIFLSMVADGAR